MNKINLKLNKLKYKVTNFMVKRNMLKHLNNTRKLFNSIVTILLFIEIWLLVIQLFKNLLKHCMNVNQLKQEMKKMLKPSIEKLRHMLDWGIQYKHQQVFGNVLCWNQLILCSRISSKNIWRWRKKLMENEIIQNKTNNED